ncbi:agmatinase [Methylobacterium haplocladii]|uniref:Guanidinopropionase n=1 Tax=Methylobacterium haplocladii TaxID=1176176 RepID=A0A512ITX0_9HYPH|nr:agmatinase [Methylobacterium haplocladii]GEP01079.1 guanidinopropionase [Methylobacterium haplocladii]GJD85616.1 Guanidinopropionase [Methylobacterium haplocladii]GLS61194.1 guanidinopropionase [Methylobacterium haplocladii]
MAEHADRLARFRPASGMDTPRFSGVPSFMRLPVLDPEVAPGAIEIGLIGIPFDGATTNRPGARFGPRGVREASTGTRAVNHATGIAPYALAACADLGDVPVNPVDVAETVRRIEAFHAPLVTAGIVPLSVGGDHLLTYPVLRALGAGQPLGLIHIDAHSDTDDGQYGGSRLTHGTPFRRAVEDGVLDPRRCVQIGIRGSLDAADERAWALAQGIRIVEMEEVCARGLPEVAAEARAIVGAAPAYLSFDIDALDPAFAPGTGTPEIGGFSTREALHLLRSFRGVDWAGADLVEVAPPLDPSGITAITGGALLFEILCLLAEAVARRRG